MSRCSMCVRCKELAEVHPSCSGNHMFVSLLSPPPTSHCQLTMPPPTRPVTNYRRLFTHARGLFLKPSATPNFYGLVPPPPRTDTCRSFLTYSSIRPMRLSSVFMIFSYLPRSASPCSFCNPTSVNGGGKPHQLRRNKYQGHLIKYLDTFILSFIYIHNSIWKLCHGSSTTAALYICWTSFPIISGRSTSHSSLKTANNTSATKILSARLHTSVMA